MRRASNKANHVLEEAAKHWRYVAPLLAFPKNKSEYRLLVKRLDQLLDIIGNNEDHPLMSLVDVLAQVISSYEDQHDIHPEASGLDALKYFMELHGLKQSDLPEIGSQGVISEILHGKRKLNVRQMQLLSKRFHVSPATFIDQDAPE